MNQYNTDRVDRLRVQRKPVMHTHRLLVGHDYLANEEWEVGGYITITGLAIKLARRQLMNDDVVLPHSAKHDVFYVNQGYVVTFVWTEWEEIEEPELSALELTNGEFLTVMDIASVILSTPALRKEIAAEVTLDDESMDSLYLKVEEALKH